MQDGEQTVKMGLWEGRGDRCGDDSAWGMGTPLADAVVVEEEMGSWTVHVGSVAYAVSRFHRAIW